jgi:16S rRNA (cytosine967-C5)-methyltransferase
VLPEENEEIANSFLKTAKDFSPGALENFPAEVQGALDLEGYLRPLPHLHDTDGFFAARFERRK